VIDEAAREALREPSAVRRLLNINGRFGPAGDGLLNGPPEQWAEQLAELSLEHGFSAYILASDDPEVLATFGQEVGPALRERVAEGRAETDDGARPSD
jgi:alkanesulfonate monooxygenase SsuD/methylene tetrahydromethanopterin reductase-like flavin-dependent oxidoreductase (luciferase family)